jgi:6-phosphogluconolactonase (cycloisomerase 2 family)
MASQESGDPGFVYVMTNQDTINAVTVFDRAPDGTLMRAGTFPTGGVGNGGKANPIDPLFSQSALAQSEDGRFLFAVNANSNDVSVLAVETDGLRLVAKESSGGVRPVSLTVSEDLLYVLNQGDSTISGFRIATDGTLSALAGSTQTLPGGAAAGASTIQFAPGGSALVVTELGANMIDVFPIDANGLPGTAVQSASNGIAPFGFVFAGKDLLIVTEAGPGTVSSYRLAADGTLSVITGSAPTTQAATCWVMVNSATQPQYAYVSNAASSTISGFRIEGDGSLTPLDADGRTGFTGSGGPLDNAITADGRFLYALVAGTDVVVGFEIEDDGSLTPLAGPAGIQTGSQGLVAR